MPRLSNGVRGNVLVGLGDDGKPRQHRVAVMPVAGSRIPAVRHFVPHRIGDELVLRLQRPVAVTAGVAAVNALHFLQEQDVGGHPAQLVRATRG